MPRDPAHLSPNRELERRRRLAAACVLLGAITLVAAFLAAHPRAGWVALNAIVWGPSSLVLCVFARELLRALLARTLGFRLFEIQWGAGRALGSMRIGACTLRLAALPLLGHVEAASASPRHHHLKRWAIAGFPALAQLCFAFFLHPMVVSAEQAVSEGFAPLAILETANWAGPR